MIDDIVIILCLIIVKGLVTAASTSLTVLDLKKNKYSSDKNPDMEKLSEILSKSRQYTNTASVINALFGIIIGFILAFRTFGKVLQVLLSHLPNIPVVINEIIAAIIIILVTTYFFAMFSLLLPKTFANKYPVKIVLKLKGLLAFFSVICSPIVWLVDISSELCSKIFTKKSTDEGISEEEILMMVDASGEQGSIDEQEKEMINNIFDFDDKNVVDIATHRKDIVALPIDAEFDDIISLVKDLKYSRIPVYEEDIDNIIGILHIKDFMRYIILYGKDKFNLKKLLREPYFVPFTKKTNDLFKELQSKKIHMAVVADEYGGTAGIVTMEDLIEEVMGDIQDEYDDEEEPEIKTVSENVIKIEGSTDLEDVADELEIEMPVDEYDTLGGFIIGVLDRIPEPNEKGLKIEYKGYRFYVDKVEDNRIAQVTVLKLPDDEISKDNKN